MKLIHLVFLSTLSLISKSDDFFAENFGLYRTEDVLQHRDTTFTWDPNLMDDTWYFIAQTPAIDNYEYRNRRNYKVKWTIGNHDGVFGEDEEFFLLDYDWEYLGFRRSDTAVASYIFNSTIPLFYLIRGNTPLGESRRNETIRIIHDDGSNAVLYRQKNLNLLQIRQVILIATGTTIDFITAIEDYISYFGFDPEDLKYFQHDS